MNAIMRHIRNAWPNKGEVVSHTEFGEPLAKQDRCPITGTFCDAPGLRRFLGIAACSGKQTECSIMKYRQLIPSIQDYLLRVKRQSWRRMAS